MKISWYLLKQTNVSVSTTGIRQVVHKYWAVGLICVVLLFSGAVNALGEIRFKEVTQDAGIIHNGATFGASWGDFNGDGWPDLWVGNHNSKPCLYLNQRDGTFVNIMTIALFHPKVRF